jgi:hypothetical protein
MAQRSFSVSVDDWVRKSRQRLEAVLKTSAQFVIEDVVLRTPVDTGYLRASLTVSLDGPLPMRGDKGDGYAAPPYALAIAGADIGSTITASFVANYAGFVEYGARGRQPVGMVRLSAQEWPRHVNRAVAEAKARVG